jgi:hypothetical protein
MRYEDSRLEKIAARDPNGALDLENDPQLALASIHALRPFDGRLTDFLSPLRQERKRPQGP